MLAIRSFALAMLFSAIALNVAAEDYSLPTGVHVLDEKEIFEQVIGNTYVAGSMYIEYYAPPTGNKMQGIIKGYHKHEGRAYTGTWTVKGHLMCWDYEEGDTHDGCYMTNLTNNAVTWYYPNGSVYRSWATTVKLTAGNPNGL